MFNKNKFKGGLLSDIVSPEVLEEMTASEESTENRTQKQNLLQKLLQPLMMLLGNQEHLNLLQKIQTRVIKLDANLKIKVNMLRRLD